MKRLMNLPVFMILLTCGWTQEIVLKASFAGPQQSRGPLIQSFVAVDVNNDGTPEIPIYPDLGYCLLDITTYNVYSPYPQYLGIETFYPQSFEGASVYLSNLRSSTLFEWIRPSRNSVEIYEIADVVSGDLLMQLPVCCYFQYGWPEVVIADYDSDGLDDVIFRVGQSERQVYGIANGSPPLDPPQDLDIQMVGNDFVINWTPVANATAYRVLWSSHMDGVTFTRIGYTTDNTFTHRNQAEQERGFYRVMSEDNGTGVVRLVGSTK